MNRNLDRCYFRVCRAGKWENICFSDLTKKERVEMCENRSAEWYKSLCYHLADCLHYIGEEFDIMGVDVEDE